MIEPKTLKGFRDFLPKDAKKRQYVIAVVKSAFESFGFEPLETPALEYEEILAGKYGDEGDKLMYRFVDQGKRRVAMRYDQTVPLSRVVAQYQNQLPLPFKRYQIQNVWRAENTQKGRFREFLQCDCDIVGMDTPLSDAVTVMTAAKTIEKLGFTDFKILINDRNIFSSLVKSSDQGLQENEMPIFVRAIDKLKKIGKEKVLEELVENGIPRAKATFLLESLLTKQPTLRLGTTFDYLKTLGLKESQFMFVPTLARGLDYYTGLIFEIEIENYLAGSIAGGGRYNNLIGMFARNSIPAVGFALGFDRIVEAMEEKNLFPADLYTTQVLITIFSPDLEGKSLGIYKTIQNAGIHSEIYLDENMALEKQLKYANQKSIPYVVVIGPDEAMKDVVQLKNMQTREQKMVTMDELITILQEQFPI